MAGASHVLNVVNLSERPGGQPVTATAGVKDATEKTTASHPRESLGKDAPDAGISGATGNTGGGATIAEAAVHVAQGDLQGGHTALAPSP